MVTSNGLKNVFFAKDRDSALARIKRLANEDRYYRCKSVRLNKKQVPHSSGWKTWKIVKQKSC